MIRLFPKGFLKTSEAIPKDSEVLKFHDVFGRCSVLQHSHHDCTFPVSRY